jgi:hypothetical protein
MLNIKSLALALIPFAAASPYLSQLNLPQPATVAAGSSITASFKTAIYIQNWEDFSIVWGLERPSVPPSADEVYIGQQIDYTTIYPDHRAEVGVDYKVDVKIPENMTPGEYRLFAAVPYLVGVNLAHSWKLAH